MALDNDEEIELPDIEYFDYIIEYISELGYSESNGMGLNKISWKEIESWSTVTKTRLSPFVARQIKHLSECYVDQFIKSKDRFCPSPYPIVTELTDDKRDKIAEGFKRMARQFKQ